MAVTDPKPVLGRHELPEDDLAHKRAVSRSFQDVARGRVPWVAEGTLTHDGATLTTTFQHDNVTKDSFITFMPMNAAAAALMNQIWIGLADLVPGTAFSGSQVGNFTVHHPAIAVGVVATFRFMVTG